MSFTDDEVTELRRLLEIEKIRKVMQRYSHLNDGRDWDGMAALYTEDAVGEWGPYGSWSGRAAIHRALTEDHPPRLPYDGLHITTNFWIELTAEDSAVSRAYLTDVWPEPGSGDNPVVWYAMYENDYQKIDGEWKISRSTIEWIWPKRIVSDGFPRPIRPTPIG